MHEWSCDYFDAAQRCLKGIAASAIFLGAALSLCGQKPNGGTQPSPQTAPTQTSTQNPVPLTANRIDNRSLVPNDSLSRRPIFISGKVVLNDGAPPPEPAKIERVCNGSPHIEAYSDAAGAFSFQLGTDFMMQDASVGRADGLSERSAPNMAAPSSPPRTITAGISERQLYACDLRAELPGFRSDNIPLAYIHRQNDPNIGVIVLHRLGNVVGLTVSATSALAPKEARTLYRKAEEAETKNKPAEAEEAFAKVVAIYPKYAAAWFELGKLSEQRRQLDEARKDYQQSLTADSKYLPPLDRLAWMTLQEGNWEKLEELTRQLLSLDPFNYPSSHYMNAVANLQLKHYDLAEKSAREAIRLDPARRNMRSHYILGLILAAKHEYNASAESIRIFWLLLPAVRKLKPFASSWWK